VRYACYADWLQHSLYLLAGSFKRIGKDIASMRTLMNKLNKDNKKIYQRKIAKQSHANPLIVFSEIVAVITKPNYDNVIPVVVNCMTFCTDLSLDVAIFLVLRLMTGRQDDKVDFERASTKPWFRNCCLFISNFYKKHIYADVTPVFVHLLSALLSM